MQAKLRKAHQLCEEARLPKEAVSDIFLDSLVSALRSPDFFRIRVGIGRPARRHENVDFVLDRFSKREWRELDVLIEDAADAVLSIIDDGLEATQNHFNRGGIAP